MTQPERAAGEATPTTTNAPSSRPTSLSLLQRARHQDPDAWSRIVHLYSPLAYFWCSRRGLRPADADDVLQDLFRTALIRLDDFRRDRPGDTFRGWLRGITRNLLLAHFRRVNQQPQAVGGSDAWQRLQEVPGQKVAADDEDDPPATVDDLYRRALELVRGEFEERTWQAFWAAAVSGRKPADVAAELGITAAAVRQAKSRVLRRLKQEVGDVIS